MVFHVGDFFATQVPRLAASQVRVRKRLDPPSGNFGKERPIAWWVFHSFPEPSEDVFTLRQSPMVIIPGHGSLQNEDPCGESLVVSLSCLVPFVNQPDVFIPEAIRFPALDSLFFSVLNTLPPFPVRQAFLPPFQSKFTCPSLLLLQPPTAAGRLVPRSFIPLTNLRANSFSMRASLVSPSFGVVFLSRHLRFLSLSAASPLFSISGNRS